MGSDSVHSGRSRSVKLRSVELPMKENARRAAFSFFPKRSGSCAPEAFVVAKQPSAALSVTRRCGALAAF